MHSQQPPGVVQNWSTLQCSKQNTEQCGYDHAPMTRGRMRAQFPLPHGPQPTTPNRPTWTPPPPPADPPTPPPPSPLPDPPPPLGAFGPLLLGGGGGVASKSEETSPPCTGPI